MNDLPLVTLQRANKHVVLFKSRLALSSLVANADTRFGGLPDLHTSGNSYVGIPAFERVVHFAPKRCLDFTCCTRSSLFRLGRRPKKGGRVSPSTSHWPCRFGGGNTLARVPLRLRRANYFETHPKVGFKTITTTAPSNDTGPLVRCSTKAASTATSIFVTGCRSFGVAKVMRHKCATYPTAANLGSTPDWNAFCP